MKFFSSKIVTKPISLEDAVKNAKAQPKVRSLDEIIASVKQVKMAAAKTEVKTAIAEAPKVEAAKTESVKEPIKAEAPKKTESPKTEAKAETQAVQIKTAKELAPAAATTPVVQPSEAKSIKPAEPKAAQAAKHTLKIASSLDFRNWEAQTVADAWKQHGTVEQCITNVGKQANDPKTYCGLLQVAASEANKIIKAAGSKKQTKTASPAFKKIAKLTPAEQSFLREYFGKIYGKEYVDALLGDF